MSEMKLVMKSLLDLPMEIKKNNIDDRGGSGYLAPSCYQPLYESLGLYYDVGSSHDVQTFCSQVHASSDQREVIEKYTQAIYELILDLCHKLVESFGLEKASFKGWPCLFRFNKYNFSPESVGSSGVLLHSDKGFITIVQDDYVGGLEIMDRSGTFVPVDPCADTLLVNLGDMSKVWSNGRLCNVKHRVQCKEPTIRFSIAAFLLGPNDQEPVEAPSEFVDSEHPRLYIPFTIEDYRMLRVSVKGATGEALELLRAKS